MIDQMKDILNMGLIKTLFSREKKDIYKFPMEIALAECALKVTKKYK